jgi:hypothetical protein
MNENCGHDLEEEHDGSEPGEDSEPDIDDEPMGGWANEGDQSSRNWIGTAMHGMLPTGLLA